MKRTSLILVVSLTESNIRDRLSAQTVIGNRVVSVVKGVDVVDTGSFHDERHRVIPEVPQPFAREWLRSLPPKFEETVGQ
ncbi:MAG: hypothetical protein HYR76_13375 [Ignavibacteria bacterium]|nr:hypothetical protein [Ignavibacteria bacterium]